MKKNYIKILINSLSIAVIGVFVVDYFVHLLFSSPMETAGYFMVKMILYFAFSILFLAILDLNKNEFVKAVIGGVVVSSMWGVYYNVLPLVLDYYPAGISLSGITFLGLGFLGTGIAFGVIHILAFIGGYYASKLISS